MDVETIQISLLKVIDLIGKGRMNEAREAVLNVPRVDRPLLRVSLSRWDRSKLQTALPNQKQYAECEKLFKALREAEDGPQIIPEDGTFAAGFRDTVNFYNNRPCNPSNPKGTPVSCPKCQHSFILEQHAHTNHSLIRVSCPGCRQIIAQDKWHGVA